MAYRNLLVVFALTWAAVGCTPDDPELAKETCMDWCTQSETQGCNNVSVECEQYCDNSVQGLPEDCLSEWIDALDCQIDVGVCTLSTSCLEDAVDTSECVSENLAPQ